MTSLTLQPFTVPRLVPGSVEHRTQPYVSASVCAALFGCHPWIDLAGLAAMRRGEPVDPAGEAADTGTELEDVIAQRWAERNGVTVYAPEHTYVCGPISSNPDRLILGCTDTILQIKATSHQEGPLPSHVWWQEQAELLTTGATQAVVAFLFGGSLCFREFVVDRDDSAIAALVDAADNFLAALDMGLEPPVVHRDPSSQEVQVGAQEEEWLRDLMFYAAAENDAKAERKWRRGKLDAALGGPGLPAGSSLRITSADGVHLGTMRRCRGAHGDYSEFRKAGR